MTGVQLFEVVILSLLLLAAIILFAVWLGRSTRLAVKVGKVLDVKVRIGDKDKAAVSQDITRAAQARGAPTAATPVRTLPSSVQLERVLWLDDNPDNNIYETIALQRVGLPVTKTTTGAAALRYLQAGPYAVIIADLGRPNDPMPPAEFIRRAKVAQPELRLVGYTSPAWADQDPEPLGLNHLTADPTDLVSTVLNWLSTPNAGHGHHA